MMAGSVTQARIARSVALTKRKRKKRTGAIRNARAAAATARHMDITAERISFVLNVMVRGWSEMTDEEIVDAVKDKHGIAFATGVYRKAHLALVSMARDDERAAIIAWLRESPHFINAHEIADAIEYGDHLK
jgi:hypothetical protein